MICEMHPRETGGEVKTIGLSCREGQTMDDRYAEWLWLRNAAADRQTPRADGPVCTCSRKGHCLLRFEQLPNGIGVAASLLTVPPPARFLVEVALNVAARRHPHLEYGALTARTLGETLAEFERLKSKWAKSTHVLRDAELIKLQ